MYVLITYDVATSEPGGPKRLRRVAKACLDHGQRVQFSVFECQIDPGRFAALKARLLGIVDLEKDSLRFYLLGNNWERRVEHYGAKASYNINDSLIV